jgi:hypothetical protein
MGDYFNKLQSHLSDGIICLNRLTGEIFLSQVVSPECSNILIAPPVIGNVPQKDINLPISDHNQIWYFLQYAQFKHKSAQPITEKK